LHLDGRRTVVLRRQKLQKRTEALQRLQGQARSAPVRRRRRRPGARRNHNQLLGLRQGNDRALPADTGPPCVLPRVLPVAEIRWCRRRLDTFQVRRNRPGHAPAWPSSSRNLFPRRESLSQGIPTNMRIHSSLPFVVVLLLAACNRGGAPAAGGASKGRGGAPAA